LQQYQSQPQTQPQVTFDEPSKASRRGSRKRPILRD
jgi:hypothetical protein